MKRRDTATALLMLGATPLAAFAQAPKKVWRLGYLVTTGTGPSAQSEAFKEGLRELGYVEDKDYVMEMRLAQGQLDRLPALAAELVRLRVDVIMVGSSAATRAAKAATTTIPIVMLSLGEPVRSGLVESLARPGGNVTGTSNSMVDIAPKHLDLLRDLAPKPRRVAFLMSSGAATHQDILEIVRAHAPRAGVQITPLAVSSEADIEAAFASMVKQKLQAVIVPTSAQMIEHRQLIADLALKSRLPCLGYNAMYAEAGFLLSYGANLLEIFKRGAVYVDKILKGTKPADLPIEMPTLFELVINKKTAQAIGLTIPRALLVRADRVIE